MPTVVLKLFAGQGTGRTGGRTKRRLYASPYGEHKNKLLATYKLVFFIMVKRY